MERRERHEEGGAVCPWCNKRHDDALEWMGGGTRHVCDGCGGRFSLAFEPNRVCHTVAVGDPPPGFGAPAPTLTAEERLSKTEALLAKAREALRRCAEGYSVDHEREAMQGFQEVTDCASEGLAALDEGMAALGIPLKAAA